MELYVFHMDTFERLGVIDSYQSLEFVINYRKHSSLDLIVDATAENIDYFINNSNDIVLTKDNDLKHGYLIETVKYVDDKKSQLEVYCKSLGSMLGWRQIDGQQSFEGTVEDALRYFVNKNAINPTNTKRKINGLVLGPLNGITDTTSEAFTNKPLDESLWEICVKFDIAYDVLLDIKNKQFVFTVWKGIDRSTEQSINEPVIFSKEFDNVLAQNYVDDKSDYRNVCIIAGEGEGTARTYLVINDEISGRQRREMFVDARDLQSENEDETTMSSTQYEALLKERGKNKLAENERVRTFETDVDYGSQFVYGVDYQVGDNVTIRNDEIDIAMHTRVVTATEKYTKSGFELSTEFGSNIPTLLSKIKKVVKQ